MWSPQLYLSQGLEKGVSQDILDNAIKQSELTIHGPYSLPSILTLNHLAKRTNTPYFKLRKVVCQAKWVSYKKFAIRKRSGGKRYIHVPAPYLMDVHRWINVHILKKLPVHPCSFAFSPGGSILKCANRHTGAKWLIKMDITGFFESISEIQVYRVFREIGYVPLVAFELARITTIPVGKNSPRRNDDSWKVRKASETMIDYNKDVLGYLPQGAPTSPMLSNLVMKDLDEEVSKIAQKEGLVYTRYGDDFTFSKRSKSYSRKQATDFVSLIGSILRKSGFKPQNRKTVIVSPGSRKIVLGLQVDGAQPTLRKEFKNNLRQHIYHLEKQGVRAHADHRKFDTIWGMKCHIRGLIDYAHMIEPKYAGMVLKKFENIQWPF